MALPCRVRYVAAGLLALCSLNGVAGSTYTLTFHGKDGNFTVLPGELHDGSCWAHYTDEIQGQSGWATLDLQISPSLQPEQAALCLGLLEGSLTAERVLQWNKNYIDSAYGDSSLGSGHYPVPLMSFIREQIAWIKTQIKMHSDDSYWEYMGLLLAQLDGLAKGCAHTKPDISYATWEEMLLQSNFMTDAFEVAQALEPSPGLIKDCTGCGPMPEQQDLRYGHCSALLRVKADKSDVFMAQNSWWAYSTMMPTFKWYPMLGASSPGRMGFSASGFGQLFSNQDFAFTNRGLVLISTTNDLADPHGVQDKLSPHTVPGWMRYLYAATTATSGEDFLQRTKRFNSGSYDNEWIVFDQAQYNQERREMSPGAVHVADNAPSAVYMEEVTEKVLSAGYWASYNRPYFKELYDEFGWSEAAAKWGPQFSYNDTARAQIFRLRAPQVEDLEEMQRLMRWNHFQTDPLSHGSPLLAIAARGDLVANSTCKWDCLSMGAVDFKLTTPELARGLRAWVAAGPTHDTQPVFSWANPALERITARRGLPETYNFSWVLLEPFFKDAVRSPESILM